MGATFEYSLIRALPDRRRGEWVNIGMLVYLPDSLDIRLLDNLSKLRILHPTLDAAMIMDIRQTWDYFCKGIESAAERQALLGRMPFVHASPTATFACDVRDYERHVLAIMRDLVIPPPQPRQQPQESRLQTTLKSMFKQARILGHQASDIERHLVVPNFPIDANAGICADFALRNGKLRITETIDFRVGTSQIRQKKRAEAGLKAVSLNMAARRFGDAGCVPSVVYAASTETLDMIQPSLNLLGDYAERLYDLGNQNDCAAYLQMMQTAAGSGIALDAAP